MGLEIPVTSQGGWDAGHTWAKEIKLYFGSSIVGVAAARVVCIERVRTTLNETQLRTHKQFEIKSCVATRTGYRVCVSDLIFPGISMEMEISGNFRKFPEISNPSVAFPGNLRAIATNAYVHAYNHTYPPTPTH